jgi:2'-5' RNA ligase
MSNLVLVAIPSEDDYVWKISSEKVPHMTILFLGDAMQPNVAKMMEFIGHAVSTGVYRFGMEVDHRGTLGADQADVLFFDMQWNDWLVDWRAMLLKDDNIFKAYNSVEQFDEFQPHLTLGYPDTPAHEDTRDYPGIHWVNFDRIALWFGDYQGVEFPLKNRDYGDVAVGWSETAQKGEDMLVHFGVKGMKWGVRKDKPRARSSSDASAAAKAHHKARAKGLHTLSNQEIQALTKRVEMETKYNKIQKDNKKTTKGHNAVKGVLALGATINAAILFANSPAGRAVGSGLSSAAKKGPVLPAGVY